MTHDAALDRQLDLTLRRWIARLREPLVDEEFAMEACRVSREWNRDGRCAFCYRRFGVLRRRTAYGSFLTCPNDVCLSAMEDYVALCPRRA